MRRYVVHSISLLLLLSFCFDTTPSHADQSAFDRAAPDIQALGKSSAPVEPGAPTFTSSRKGSEGGTPGLVGPKGIPPGNITPGLSSPGVPPKPQFQPPQICQAILQLVQQLIQPSGQQGGSQSSPSEGGSCGPGGCNLGNTNQPRAPGLIPPPVSGGTCGPGGCSGPFRSAADRTYRALKRASFSESSFGFDQPFTPVRVSRKALDTDQSYQYLGAALVDNQCRERERTRDEIEQLVEALDKVEADQKKQSSNQSQQDNQGAQIASQILQGLLGALGGGGLGGGGGAGGSPAAGGGGSGKNPWEDAYRDTTRPTTLAELNEKPESLDKLTDKELLALLQKGNFCEDLDEEVKKKVEERLAEIRKKQDQIVSEESKKIQELIDQNGTPPLENLAEGWNRANDTDQLIFSPESQSMIDAIDESIKSGGTALPHGNDATQAVGLLANDIMKSNMSAADKATALGSLRYTVYQQQSDALFSIGQNASASQAWSNFNHNVGLMSEGLRDRLAVSSDKWLQASTTPASSVREFLSYSGYPGATNVNQGGYGSCWLCPTTGLNYRANPGELAMMQNQGLTTGRITSPWTGQTANVSNWLKSPDNALYNPNAPVQNLRSPLITMDQEAMAQFGGYRRAGGGGNPYVGLEKGSYAYTGGVGDLVSGSREGAGFLSSQTLQQMAWAPRHYWSKDKINGTRIDSSGNYVAHTTLVGNNSWGSQPYETGRPFTAAGLASITMPGGGGALGGGGGGGLASILGGNLSGFGGLGSSSNNNQNQGSPRPNPLDEPALRACLADICSDIAAQQLEIPQSCKDVSFAVASTSQAGQEKDVDGQSNETVKSTTTANSVDEDRLARLLKRVRQDTARRRVEFSRASGAH